MNSKLVNKFNGNNTCFPAHLKEYDLFPKINLI